MDNTMQGRRVLVTGGHGFIGSPLCRRLASLGASVIAVSRTPHPDAPGIRSVALDLTDQMAVDRLFVETQPDTILHLASHVVGHRSPEVVLSTLHNNLTSTVHLLLAAERHRCRRVVLTGSLEEPTPDGDWPVPSSPYAAAKLAAGSYGRMFQALFGLPVITLRVFMVYGPGQADLKKLIPYVVTSLKRGETPVLSSGTREVDWIYVDDVVDAYVQAARHDGIDGATIDVGRGELYTVREVVERLFRIMGRSEPPRFGGQADRQMEQVRIADVARSEALLGWRAKVTLTDGLERTARWYSALV